MLNQILMRKVGTTMIKWSLEKATMIGRSRMHFACYNFENKFVYKLFISKILQNMFSEKLFRLKIVITIVYILKFARFTLFHGSTTI